MKRQRQPAQQSGYVLVTVTLALALLALIASRYAGQLDVQRAEVAALRAEVEAERRADSLLQVLFVRLSSQPLGERGIGRVPGPEWVADGRWYRAGAGLYFSLQDQRGLLSVHDADRRALTALLEQEGVPLPRQQRLIDVLADYTDTDSLRRLSGAEAADYEREGLPPPRNDFMRGVSELAQLPTWRDEPKLIERLTPLLSVRVNGLFNPNTAPRRVLQAWFPEASTEQLDILIRLREALPFRDGAQLQQATGLPASNGELMFHAGTEILLQVWAEGMPRARAYNLRLEPGSLHAPWLVLAYQSMQRPNFSNATGPAVDSPLPLPALPR